MRGSCPCPAAREGGVLSLVEENDFESRRPSAVFYSAVRDPYEKTDSVMGHT